jgi:YXWGXW repeat-containing protein
MSTRSTPVLQAALALAILGAISIPTFSAVNFSFGVEVAPPPPTEAPPPPPRAGFIWAPGYWSWDDGRYVWVQGHWMEARPGYYWVPDGWEHHVEERGPHWHFAPGHWEPLHEHWAHERGHGRGAH